MKLLFAFFIISGLLYAESITAVIKIEGMTCPMCTTAIKKSLKKIDGVQNAKVKLNTELATVTSKKKVTKTQILQAIKDVGYTGTIISIK